ncbi:Uncharacterised protein [Mycobacteroides abscessus subsp. abscessus]|nr:Uncharacterised protein [Mycobacteroides abscessus subsp. abscessus]
MTGLPKPQAEAMVSTGQSVVSSRARASSRRRSRIQRAGVVPVACWKWRTKLRRLMRARSASPIAPSVAGRASGRSMYWAWPPSRCGATTRLRATRVAAATPRCLRTRCRQASMAEAVPAEVSTSPWSM